MAASDGLELTKNTPVTNRSVKGKLKKPNLNAFLCGGCPFCFCTVTLGVEYPVSCLFYGGGNPISHRRTALGVFVLCVC